MEEGEEVIRLLDSSGTRVLDSVAAEYEDSFCLETFGDLAKAHMECDPKGTKSFVIARVQTWDHKQPNKVRSEKLEEGGSGYRAGDKLARGDGKGGRRCAYQLNKILFQTQIYLGKKLIHRLHVLNPLTNTDIIGNVQYFMVKNPNATAIKTKPQQSVNGHPDASRSVLATAPLDQANTSGQPAIAMNDFGVNKPAAGVKGKKRPVPASIDTGSLGVPGLPGDIPPPSPAVREVEAGGASWTMVAPSSAEVTEEQASGPGPQPRKFSIRAMGLRSPYPASPRKGSPLKHRLPDLEGEAKSPRSPSITGPKSAPVETGSSAAHRRSLAGFDAEAITKQPTGMIQMRNHHRNKTTIPLGSVTRFAVPVPVEEIRNVAPATPRTRRRSLSYVNAASTSESHTTFEEWVQIVKEDRRRKSDGNMDYDVVRGMSPTKSDGEGTGGGAGKSTVNRRLSRLGAGGKRDGNSESTTALTNNVDRDTSEMSLISVNVGGAQANAKSAPSSPMCAGTHIPGYDAILFATDNDFLESSRVRAVFRANAMVPDDAVLFEMPPFLGFEEQPAMVVVDDSAICEWCYPGQVTLERSGPLMRIFHRSKCYVAALILVTGMFIFMFFTLRAQQSGGGSTNVIASGSTSRTSG
ncbi:hypothetical protein BDK51DRAFT_29029 [Blyttiomyces helicus]|uniref:Uncharacterized protein n=1 Tax=Blyttiomyces helicus TaxID=388810 RepID=A0A4P9WQ23_9FUNG|nr:hypothetical protein BDK51DRAFT_29029 [Blyttiomyces helicus]|eukprot:RKO94672.1 hypothetical protein BDK51DRAFT_29029 [Blyttiomyces helicus]